MTQPNTLASVLTVASLSAIFSTVLLLGGCQSTPAAQSAQSTAAASSTALASQTEAALTRGLTLVDENHHVTIIGPDRYVLDSYIIPFQQPYYILVRKQSGAPFIKHAAEVVAIDYIKPRGCTEPLKRRPDLDKQSADATHYLIGVTC